MTTTPTRPKRKPIPYRPEARTIQFRLTETRTHTFEVTVQAKVSAEQVEEALSNALGSGAPAHAIESELKRCGIEAIATDMQDDGDIDDSYLELEDDTVTDDVEMYVIHRKLDDGSFEYFVKKNGTLDNTHIMSHATLFLTEPTNIIEGLNLFGDGSQWEIHVVNGDA